MVMDMVIMEAMDTVTTMDTPILAMDIRDMDLVIFLLKNIFFLHFQGEKFDFDSFTFFESLTYVERVGKRSFRLLNFKQR